MAFVDWSSGLMRLDWWREEFRVVWLVFGAGFFLSRSFLVHRPFKHSFDEMSSLAWLLVRLRSTFLSFFTFFSFLWLELKAEI